MYASARDVRPRRTCGMPGAEHSQARIPATGETAGRARTASAAKAGLREGQSHICERVAHRPRARRGQNTKTARGGCYRAQDAHIDAIRVDMEQCQERCGGCGGCGRCSAYDTTRAAIRNTRSREHMYCRRGNRAMRCAAYTTKGEPLMGNACMPRKRKPAGAMTSQTLVQDCSPTPLRHIDSWLSRA